MNTMRDSIASEGPGAAWGFARAHGVSVVAQWWPSVVSVALGVGILAMVGFAPGIAHNAAHDVRHTVAFPCH